jgi:hypothetical protein
MNHVVMDRIPFDPDVDTFSERLCIKPGDECMVRLREMVGEAKAIARPRVVYRVVRVEAKGVDYVVVDGARLASRVLRVNLDKVYRAFVYVATCGSELDRWARSMEPPVDRYEAETIAGMGLMAAHQALVEHLEQVFHPGRLGEMNPGSLPDWPLHEQRPLFDLLGDPESSIGVRLLDSYLMVPTKTASGLLFPTEAGFTNCQLCPTDDCPGRRAPYDADLYDRKYRLDTEPEPGE